MGELITNSSILLRIVLTVQENHLPCLMRDNSHHERLPVMLSQNVVCTLLGVCRPLQSEAVNLSL